MEGTVAPERPAEASLLPKSELRVGGDGVLVELEDAEAHAVQAPLSEGVVEERGDRLGSVAVVPVSGCPTIMESSAEAFASLMFIRLMTPIGSRSPLRWMAKESSVGSVPCP